MIAKYEYVDLVRADAQCPDPVWKMCSWLGVSKSGFYDWASREVSLSAARKAQVSVEVAGFFTASHGTYGYRRIHADLAAAERVCSPEYVRLIMTDLGLVPCQPRPFRVTTDGDPAAAIPDLVQRDFTATRPGVKFVGDITYIHTWQGFVYLLVTWNQSAWRHGLGRRRVEYDCRGATVAGVGSMPARGGVVAGVGRSGSGTSDGGGVFACAG